MNDWLLTVSPRKGQIHPFASVGSETLRDGSGLSRRISWREITFPSNPGFDLLEFDFGVNSHGLTDD